MEPVLWLMVKHMEKPIQNQHKNIYIDKISLKKNIYSVVFDLENIS